MSFDIQRLEQAQAILKTIAPHVRMWWNGGFVFGWSDHHGRVTQKRWRSRSRGSFYPSWQFPSGGTVTTAVSQLMRWVQHRPVISLRQWRYWCGDVVGMNPEAARLATEFGWPEEVPCVLCGKLLGASDRVDWYSPKDGHDGPGCWGSNLIDGCERKAVVS